MRTTTTPRTTTRTTRRWTGALVAVLVVGGLLVGCGSSGGSAHGAAGGATDTITLYSGQHEETTQALVDAFTKQTGIKVKIRSDDEATLAQQIEQEGSRSPADVFYTENSPPLMSLEQKGLLAATDASTLAKVDAKYSSPTGKWVGTSARVACLVYDTKALEAERGADLGARPGRPEVEGQAGPRPRRDRLPAHRHLDHRGQGHRPRPSSGSRRSRRTRRATPIPTTRRSSARSTRARRSSASSTTTTGSACADEKGASSMHSAVSYFAPHDPGYVLDVSGAGVLASSQHQAAAQKFVAFLVSPAGQDIIAHSNSFEYPIGSGVAANPELKPFDQLQPTDLSISQLGDGSEAVELLQQVQLL